MAPHLVIIVTLLGVGVSYIFATETTLFHRQASFDGMIFTDSLLWTSEAKSRLHCASECAQVNGCVTFTVTGVTQKLMTCRGHSQTTASLTGGTPAADTRVYEIGEVAPAMTAATITGLQSQWLKTPCTTNADCAVADTVCFENQCLCTPGYYYYKDSDACFLDCPLANLQPEVVMYPGWYILGTNIITALIPTLEECDTLCKTEPQCRSYEYNYDSLRCYIASATPLDNPTDWKAAASNVSYYQRTCIG